MIEVNTFSIVARCPDTHLLGVAVSSAIPAVGGVCPYIKSGVGAASSQSWVNPYLALDALAGLEANLDAEEALKVALQGDTRPDLRQIGLVDSKGRAAAWTGKACTESRGHRLGDGYAIQGNMLTSEEVLDDMVGAFENSKGLEFAERLLVCLEAGQAAGGDKRGKQSAAIRVQGAEKYPLHDLRCDEHPHPVAELRRIFAIARLQLLPFVQGMPKRDAPGPLPDEVSRMLMKPPPFRPGGGGS